MRQWQVCDAGCGTGFLETLLSDRVGSIVAFDASMLERARQKFPSRPIAWVQADAQALPVHAPVFDLVCSNAMLYHVFGFERVLAAMIALLKPGGCLFLGYEPNAIAYRLLGPLLKVAPTIVPEHRNRERIREAGPGRLSELRERRHQRAART